MPSKIPAPPLVQRVRTALEGNPTTAAAGIEVVEESGGVITLRGVVESREIRKEADALAEAQEGVIEVINDLEVEEDEGLSISGALPPNRAGQTYTPVYVPTETAAPEANEEES